MPSTIPTIPLERDSQHAQPPTPNGSLPPARSDHQDRPLTSAMGDLRSALPFPLEVSRIVRGRHAHRRKCLSEKTQPLSPHTCDLPDCALVKILGTPEVLEHVLSFIATRHILPLRLVNKTWDSLITDSPRLRLHLFVEPRWQHPSTDFWLLSPPILGLEIRRGDAVHLGQWVEIRMNLAAAQAIRSTSGDSTSRTKIRRSTLSANLCFISPESPRNPSALSSLLPYADLMITQPPLKGMQAFLIDAKDSSPGPCSSEAEDNHQQSSAIPVAHSKISCDAGITLGFVADVAREALQKRRFAGRVQYHQDKVVVFKAIVSYCVQSDAAPRKRSTTRAVTRIEQPEL